MKTSAKYFHLAVGP